MLLSPEGFKGHCVKAEIQSRVRMINEFPNLVSQKSETPCPFLHSQFFMSKHFQNEGNSWLLSDSQRNLSVVKESQTTDLDIYV